MDVAVPFSFGKKYSEIIVEMHLNSSFDANNRQNSYLTFNRVVGREVFQHHLERCILMACSVLFLLA